VTPAQLSAAVIAAVKAAVASGELAVEPPQAVTVERPKNREHGDYATNVALQLAKSAGRSPREIAELLAGRLRETEGIAKVDVAGPGFLNVSLEAAEQGAVARRIVEAGATHGHIDTLAGQRVNLEFISANPTGPLHLGHARWAAVGDAIGRVLSAAGAQVSREFYVNDRGVQMDRFGASLEAAALGQPIPADGYHGDYIAELAAQVVATKPTIVNLPEGERMAAFREVGYELQLAQQKAVLDAFGTSFDVWKSERSLHSSGAVERGFERLREMGHMYDADGAVWLRTTEFGDDKDRPLVKSDGELTYFASDTAYYVDKRNRGFDVCIYLLGADHHGYVHRLKSIAACAGDDPDYNIEVLIGQLVKILKSGAEVRLLRNATELGIDRGELDPTLLTHDREIDLLGALGEFPRVVASAAELREPHRVARYLEELAGVYHRFYDACRVLPQGDETATDLTRARLWLCTATRIVLANGLDLLGVSAPERM
jgi:arginyl-tRNA synthetase